MSMIFGMWHDYSERYLSMARLLEKRKNVKNAEGYGIKTGDCGDMVKIFLSIKDNTIKTVNYDLRGCINTNACCNALALLAEGKTVSQAWNLEPKDIIDFLETLPTDHHHCAELTIGTFYLSLANYNDNIILN